MVAQKLTFMTALGHKFSDTRDMLQESAQLKQAAEFIWTHQNKNFLQFSEETLALVSQYIEPQKMIELAATFVQQFQEEVGKLVKPGYGGSSNVFSSPGNPTFHYALILEMLVEIMRKIQKMKLLPNPLKTILKDVLTSQAKTILITESSFASIATSVNTEHSKDRKNILENLLSSANAMLLESTETGAEKINDEFSSQLIHGMLEFLGCLDVETYPKDVKTVVFLCSFVILVALLEQNSDNLVLEPVCKLLVSSGGQSLGNEIIFSVHWVELFRWFTARVNRFSSTSQLDVCNMILENIFMSPKFMAEFDAEIQKMCETVDMDSSAGNICLATLEFLLRVNFLSTVSCTIIKTFPMPLLCFSEQSISNFNS